MHGIGHANVFIPSTLGGTCVDINTGKTDEQKYENNVELATDVYIDRVNPAPCDNSCEATIMCFACSYKSKRLFLANYPDYD